MDPDYAGNISGRYDAVFINRSGCVVTAAYVVIASPSGQHRYAWRTRLDVICRRRPVSSCFDAQRRQSGRYLALPVFLAVTSTKAGCQRPILQWGRRQDIGFFLGVDSESLKVALCLHGCRYRLCLMGSTFNCMEDSPPLGHGHGDVVPPTRMRMLRLWRQVPSCESLPVVCGGAL